MRQGTAFLNLSHEDLAVLPGVYLMEKTGT